MSKLRQHIKDKIESLKAEIGGYYKKIDNPKSINERVNKRHYLIEVEKATAGITAFEWMLKELDEIEIKE